MRWLAVIGAIATGCYAPDPQAGAPCGSGGECPAPLMCSPATDTCERSVSDASLTPDVPSPDGCAAVAEICGDGIDQNCDGNDPPCPANDTASGAVDITAGGTFTGDLATAHDDNHAQACGGNGGRDLYYTIHLAAPRVYYLDTFGSSFDSVVRVYAKACSGITPNTIVKACGDDACGGAQSQLAVSLPAGDSCVVVDQRSGNETSGAVMLNVVATARDGAPLASGVHTTTGDTCGSTNIWDPVDVNCDAPGSGGKDLAYFFTLCPGQSLTLDANTCTNTAWDTALYVRRGDTTQIACNDDTCNFDSQLTNVAISGGKLFWLVLDGFDPTQCGAFDLETNLR